MNAGHTDFFYVDLGTIASQLRAGTVRPLAMASAKRLATVPDIPGAAEAGIPGMNLEIWWSVSVPAKTPQPIRDQLEKWFNQIVADPETHAFNVTSGSDALPGNAALARQMLVEHTKRWAEYARIAKIEPQ